MTTPANTLVEKLQSTKRPGPERATGADASSRVPGDALGVFLWRAMSGLCLLWLAAQEWAAIGAWPPAPATYVGWLGAAALAAALTFPSLIRPAGGWCRAISSLSSLLILGTFAATGAHAKASGAAGPLTSLAVVLLESGLLPALAVLALGFALPALLAGSPLPRGGRNFAAAPWLLRGLDVLAAVTGLLGLCYVPQAAPHILSPRLLAAAATVTAAALAVCAFRYRGGLVLESPERGVEFLIPERLVRGGLAAALLALLAGETLFFRASAPPAALALPFVFWVVARAAWPLLLGAGEAEEGQPTGGTLRGHAGLCAGALAALSGLLWCRAADPSPDPFTPPCLLLALAAAGAAVLGADRVGESAPAAPSEVAVTVRLRGEARPLPARAALPFLGPRGARLFALISRLVAVLRRAGEISDRALAAAAGTRSASRRLLAGSLPTLFGSAVLVLAVCWLAAKDWLASDAQDYPALASLALTLSVLVAAAVARSVRRCGPWRDLLLAGGATLCLLALALPRVPPLLQGLVPPAGLLTLALGLPRLLPVPRPGRAGAAQVPGGAAFDGVRSSPSARVIAGRLFGAAARGLKALVRGLRALVTPVDYGRLLGEESATQYAIGRARGFLREEVALGRKHSAPRAREDAAARPPLPGWVASLAYWGAALLAAAALLHGSAHGVGASLKAGVLPSLLAAAGSTTLLALCTRSPRPAARVVPFAVWGLCGFLYAWPAIALAALPLEDARGALIGSGLSGHLAWGVFTFVGEQGWVTWALVGVLLLWALDRNAQFLASWPDGAPVPGGAVAAQATERPGGRSGPDVELSVGVTAALVALLLNGSICPPILALCVASLVIAARQPAPEDAAAAGQVGEPPSAERSPSLRRIASQRPALAGVAVAAAVLCLGGLCLAAWSLSAGRPDAAPPAPRVVRDAVPRGLAPAASWRDGYALLRRCFGSRVAVPPSMSAAVATHVTGADRSQALPRALAAALLAPMIGGRVPAARMEDLYLGDRDYGLPGEAGENGPGGADLAAAAAYYFRRRPADLSPAQAHFLVGEQPASGALPPRLAPAGRAPTFVPLDVPQFRLETFAPPVPGIEYAHHDGSVNGKGACVSSVITTSGVRAFIRAGGRIRMLRGLSADDTGTFAIKINGRGQAAGWSAAPDGSDHAVLWEADGRCRDLGTLPGYTDSRARGVNDRGQVVGYAFNDTSRSPLKDASRPFLWEDGRMYDLGTPPGCTGGRAYAVNDAGQAAGWVMTAKGRTHAAVWGDGHVYDLGAFPGGKVSAAEAINDAGQVVGSAQHKGGHVTAFLWQNGIMHDLGTLPGDTYSSARDVNDLGQVVGMSRSDGHVNVHGGGAFVWDGGHGMRDLTSLMAASPSLRVTLTRDCQPFSINDRGQVLGLRYAPWGGRGRLTFLLTPGSRDDRLTPEARDERAFASRPVAGRSYLLVCAGGGRVADGKGAVVKGAVVKGASPVDGAAVVQWWPNGAASQVWSAVDLGGGAWGFVNRSSGKRLAVASAAPGGTVVQAVAAKPAAAQSSAPDGVLFQGWVLRPQADGSFEFVNGGSGLLMNVAGGSFSNGGRLDQWRANGNPNQHWLLQPVR